MKELLKTKIRWLADVIRRGGIPFGMIARNRYEVICRGPDGKIKWIDYIENLTVNTGLNDILDKYWKGSTYTALHYVGLTAGSPSPAAGDIMSSHAG